jgi:hypothetical protein
MNAMAEDVDLDLEPCINGGVSRTGDFPSQAVEDELVEKPRIKQQKALEPSIHIDPSVSVIYPSQEEDDC